jgi:hypothetical protein
VPRITLEVPTDDKGHFRLSEHYNPPGPFPLTVEVNATLLSPSDTTIAGWLDIDAADGSPQNQKKSVVASTGQPIALGSWKLDGGENIILVTGTTAPPRPNATLTFEIDGTL